jgi:hypothetical protein
MTYTQTKSVNKIEAKIGGIEEKKQKKNRKQIEL